MCDSGGPRLNPGEGVGRRTYPEWSEAHRVHCSSRTPRAWVSASCAAYAECRLYRRWKSVSDSILMTRDLLSMAVQVTSMRALRVRGLRCASQTDVPAVLARVISRGVHRER